MTKLRFSDTSRHVRFSVPREIATRDLKTGCFFAILGHGEMEIVSRQERRRRPAPDLSILAPGRREGTTAGRRSPV